MHGNILLEMVNHDKQWGTHVRMVTCVMNVRRVRRELASRARNETAASVPPADRDRRGAVLAVG